MVVTVVLGLGVVVVVEEVVSEVNTEDVVV